MSRTVHSRILSGIAAADLTTKRHYACYIDSNGEIAVQTTAGGPVLGAIAENATASARGKPVGVEIGDVVEYIAGGSINPGAAVAADANGKVVAATLGRTNTSDAGAAADALIGSNVIGYYFGQAAAATDNIVPIARYYSTGAAPTTPA